MKVYLAGPINGCDDATAKDWRKYVKEKLHLLGIETIDPMDRDYRGVEMEKFREIVEGDKADIDNSDVVLANTSIPSAGTSMEILYAWEAGLFIVSVFGVPEKNPSPWIIYHSSRVTRGLDDAIRCIIAEFGPESPDPTLWSGNDENRYDRNVDAGEAGE